MTHVALVGPEIEENLSLRYVAAALTRRGHTSDIASTIQITLKATPTDVTAQVYAY